jgi:pimeloyl-ACP methyl ester carboxylesterase
MKAVHWELFEDARDNHPTFPEVDVPVTIIHGVNDEIVDIESSRSFADQRDHVSLIEVEDEHTLYESLDVIEEACRRAWC